MPHQHVMACVALAAVLVAPSSLRAEEAASLPSAYGTPVTAAEGAVLAVAKVLGLAPRLADGPVTVQGKVSGVCQREGCWVTLVDPAQPGAGALRVAFKDHAFTVPPAMLGRTVTASGVLHVTETSVERLRHLAEDAGKAPAEIAAITAPRRETALEAEGLRVEGDAR